MFVYLSKLAHVFVCLDMRTRNEGKFLKVEEKFILFVTKNNLSFFDKRKKS